MSFPQLSHDDSDNTLDIGGPGGALATAGEAEATYQTDPKEIEVAESKFEFVGTNEVYSHYLGARTRPIVWTGVITCSDAGLWAIRVAQDTFKLLPGTFTFIDDDGTEYEFCRVARFALNQKTRIQDRGFLKWRVPYSIELEQLEP